MFLENNYTHGKKTMRDEKTCVVGRIEICAYVRIYVLISIRRINQSDFAWKNCE